MKRALVAFTPLAGALAFPLVVPLVLKHAGIPAAVLSAVAIAVCCAPPRCLGTPRALRPR